MSRIRVYPYKSGSRSARALANILTEKLDIPVKRIRHNSSNFVARENDIVINWGASSLPDNISRANIINMPHAVALSANKLHTLNAFKNDENRTRYNYPKFYTSEDEATDALISTGRVLQYEHEEEKQPTLFARTILTGHGGSGIIPIYSLEDMVPAKLYTQYIADSTEYRIHVVNGNVIDVVKKSRRNGEPPNGDDKFIRNHTHGWIFTRNTAMPCDATIELLSQAAKEAVSTLGLFFGAVDILSTKSFVSPTYPTVLEVNSAPGIMGTTLEKYGDALCHSIRQLIG